jgi:ribosome-binding protein aMBF1 (putative translation factor)
MSEAVKTLHIDYSKSVKPYLLSFKRTTPREILAEARNRYAAYLTPIQEEEYVPIAETEWYQNMVHEMTPSRYLKTSRETLGFSQAHLGELIEVPASRISDYETGQRTISKEIAKKLARVFKTSPAAFI